MASFNFRRWLSNLGSTKSKPIHRDRSRIRLHLEEIEGRIAPAVCTWIGTTAIDPTQNWNNAANWLGGTKPTLLGADQLVFSTANATPTNLPASGAFQSILFSASNVRLSGSSTFVITNGITVNAGSTNDQIGIGLVLSGAQTIKVGSGSDLSTFGLVVNGTISGSSALTINGPGTVQFGGSNTNFSGPISLPKPSGIGPAILEITNPSALGTGSVTVSNGSELDVKLSAAGTVNNALYVTGTGAIGGGSFNAVSLSANVTWAGSVSLTGATTISSASANSFIISGQITDQGAGQNLTKEGTGTVTLGGNNTYRGSTTINNGVLDITNGYALGQGNQQIVVNYDTLHNEKGTLQLDGGITVLKQTVTLNGIGFGALNGALVNGSGTNVWAGNIILNAGTYSTTVDINTNSGTLIVAGVPGAPAGTPAISGNATSFNKYGVGGTLEFDTANSYGAFTQVVQGTLRIRDSAALGTLNSTTPGVGAWVVPGAALELAGGVLNGLNRQTVDSVTGALNSMQISVPLTIWGSGPAGKGGLYSSSGINSIIGNLTLKTNVFNPFVSIGVDPPTNAAGFPSNFDITSTGQVLDDSLTINPTNSGASVTTNSFSAGNWSKVGTGMLYLPNANLISGNTTIQAGTVVIGNNSSLGSVVKTNSINSQLQTTVASGASLYLLPLGSTLQDDVQTVTLANAFSGQGQFVLNVNGQLTSNITVGAAAGALGAFTSALKAALGTGFTYGTDYTVALDSSHSAIGSWTYTITFLKAGLGAGGRLMPTIIAQSAPGANALKPGATILAATTQAGSSGKLNIGTQLNISGIGVASQYQLSNIPTYSFIGSPYGSGAVMSLAGNNIISGLIDLNATSTFGVEQVFSSNSSNPNYSANYPSQLTITGVIAETTPGQGYGINKVGSQRLILPNANSFSGNVDIQQGVVQILNDHSLGIGKTTVNPTPTTTVEAGAAIELGAAVPGLNGGVGRGLQVVNETLVLKGSGNTLFNEVPFTVLNTGNDNAWQGPISLNTYATSVNVTIPGTPTNALTGAFAGAGPGTPTLATQLLTFTGSPTSLATFVLSYNGTPRTVNWDSNATNLRNNIQAALNTLLGANAVTVYVTGPNTYALAFASASNKTPITIGTQVGIAVASSSVLTFIGTPTTGMTFTLGYGSSNVSVAWSSNTTTLTNSLRAAFQQLIPSATIPDASTYGIINIPQGNRLILSGVIGELSNADPNGSDLTIVGTGIGGANGSSELDLLGANTYKGTTYIPNGLVAIVQNGQALGSSGQSEQQTLTIPSASIVSAKTGATTVVTVTTSSPHGLSANQWVQIAGVSVAGYNGSFQIVSATATTFTYNVVASLADGTGGTATLTVPTASIVSAKTGASTVVTVTTSSPHGYLAGQWVQIAGVSVASYNGLVQIATVTATTFTYNVAAPLADGTGGAAAFVPSFTLTFSGSTTGSIPYTGIAVTDAAAIQTALNALTMTSIAGVSGSVIVTPGASGGTFTVAFSGALNGFHQPLLTTNAPGGTVTLAQDGGGGTIVASGGSLQLKGNITVVGEPVIIQGAGVSTVSATTPQWFSIGPTPVVNSPLTPNSQNASGSVTSVAFDPTDTTNNTYYVTTSDGGAWKTANGGLTWQPLFDQQAAGIFAGSIAVSPVDTNTLYLGTGSSGATTNNFYGSGLYKSKDGGQTWSLVKQSVASVTTNQQTAIATSSNPFAYAGTVISKVVPDPLVADTVFVAVSNGAYVGTAQQQYPNAGIWKFDSTTSTWTNLTASNANQSAANISGAVLQPDPVRGNEMLITTQSPHSFLPGQLVTIAGVSPSSISGTYTVTSVPNTTQFTINYSSLIPPTSWTGAIATIPVGYGNSPKNIERVGSINDAIQLVYPVGTSAPVVLGGTGNDGLTLVSSGLSATPTGGASIVWATTAGTTVTVTTSANHNYHAGQSVVISGVDVAGYNGTFVITNVPNANSFTYTVPAALPNAQGGVARAANVLTLLFGGFTDNYIPSGGSAPKTMTLSLSYQNTGAVNSAAITWDGTLKTGAAATAANFQAALIAAAATWNAGNTGNWQQPTTGIVATAYQAVTSMDPQLFVAGDAITLNQTSWFDGTETVAWPAVQTQTPTEPPSPNVILYQDDTQWGHWPGNYGYVQGTDTRVNFYTQGTTAYSGVTYSDLSVMVDPQAATYSALANNRIIAFGLGTPWGGSDMVGSSSYYARYSNGVYISVDGGATFQEGGFPTTSNLNPAAGNIKVAMATSGGKITVYASLAYPGIDMDPGQLAPSPFGPSATPSQFYETISNTLTYNDVNFPWTRNTPWGAWGLGSWTPTTGAAAPPSNVFGALPVTSSYASTPAIGQLGQIFSALAMDPANPNTIFIAGVGQGATVLTTKNVILYYNGTSWIDITQDSTGNGPGAGVTSLVYLSASKTLLAGTTNGLFLFQLTNAATGAGTWTSANTNLAVAQYNSIASNPTSVSPFDPNSAVGGVVNNGIVQYNGSVSGQTWGNIDNNINGLSPSPSLISGNQVAYDPRNPNNVYQITSAVTGTTNGVAGVAIKSASDNFGLFTIVTASNHGLVVGDQVTLYGVSNPGYNGTYTVTAVLAANSFQVNTPALANFFLGGGAGGTATRVPTSPAAAQLVNQISQAGTLVTAYINSLTGISAGTQVTITGTVNYNGTYQITNVGQKWLNGGQVLVPYIQFNATAGLPTETPPIGRSFIGNATIVSPAVPLTTNTLWWGTGAPTWTNINPNGLPNVKSFWFDPISGRMLAIATDVTGNTQTVWQTSNPNSATPTWINITPAVTYGPFQGALIAGAQYQGAFQSDSNYPNVVDQGANAYVPDTLYMVSPDSTFYYTKDDATGFAWKNQIIQDASGNRIKGTITSLVVDPTNSYTVYLTDTYGEVWKTTNAGANWTNLATYGNLPALSVVSNGSSSSPVWALAVDPRSGYVYVGTDYGVYYLNPSAPSPTWQVYGVGLPAVQVRSIDLNQQTNTLTIGTYGRGAFAATLLAAPANVGALVADSGSAVWTGPVILADKSVIAALGTQTLQNGISAAQLNITGSISDLSYHPRWANEAVSGVIASPQTAIPELTKSGFGTVVFSGANTYAGVTDITQGVLLSNNVNSLTGSATVVRSGASLELEASLGNEPLYLFGDGIQVSGHNTGALRAISGNDTYTGTINLQTNVTIGVDSGATLTIGDGLGNGTITDGGAGYSVTKELTGTLIYADKNTYGSSSGATTNVTLPNGVSYAGGTIVSQGSLIASNSLAFADVLPPSPPVTTTTVLDGAQLGLQAVTVAGIVSATSVVASGTNTATITMTAVPANFAVGQAVTISGVGVAAYNGTYVITNKTATTITYILASLTALAQSSGGTASVYAGSVNINENLNLSGSGIFGTGALYSLGGANSVTGNVTITQNSAFGPPTNPPTTVSIGVDPVGNSSTGTLTINGQMQQQKVGNNEPFTIYFATPGLQNLSVGSTSLNGSLGVDISTASQVGNTVTITTSAAHKLDVGERVTLANILNTKYNGTFTVASVLSATQFTVANNAYSNLPNSSGGKATGIPSVSIVPIVNGASINAVTVVVVLGNIQNGSFTIHDGNTNLTTGSIAWDSNPANLAANIQTALSNIGDPTRVTHGLGLDKVGQGTLILNKPVTFTGQTTVSTGVLELAASGSYGNIYVSPGAALATSSSGSITVNANVYLNGTGFTPAPAVSNVVAATEDASNNVTITTSAPHGFQAGQSVTLANIGVAAYNGTFIIQSTPTPTSFTVVNTNSGMSNAFGGTATISSASIASASEAGNTVTITTAAAHGLQVGQQVTLSGIAGTNVAGYNGTYTVLSVPSATTFTLYNPNLGLANFSSPGGIVAFATVAALDNFAGNNILTGNLILQTNATIGAEGSTTLQVGNIQDFTPVSSPPATLSKEGTGTVLLPNANTYAGNTYVNQGVVSAANKSALGGVATPSIIGASDAGDIVTLTTSMPYGFAPGQQVTISGTGKYDGTYAILGGANVPTLAPLAPATTFSVQIPGLSSSIIPFSGTGTATLSFAQVQTVTVITSLSNAGTFQLSFGGKTTNPISLGQLSMGALQNAIQTELNNLPGNGGTMTALLPNQNGNVYTFNIVLGGTFLGFDQPTITAIGGVSPIVTTSVVTTIHASGGVEVLAGAALDLQGSITVSNQPLKLDGGTQASYVSPGGTLTGGTLSSSVGNNTWDSPVTLNGAGSTVNVAASGNPSFATLTVDQAIVESATGTGVNVNAPGLDVDGGGQVNFSGSASNTYTGVTQVSNGTLNLNKSGGAFAFSSTSSPGLIVGDGIGAADSATLLLSQSSQFAAATAVQVNADGKFDLGGQSQTIAGLILNSGHVSLSGASVLTFAGDPEPTFHILEATSTNAGYGSLIDGSGSLALNNASAIDRVFDVQDGPASIDLAIQAAITRFGAESIFKSGAGRLEIGGIANVYGGPLRIDGGDVQVDTANSSMSVALNGGSLSGGARSASSTASVGAITDPNTSAMSTVNPGDNGNASPIGMLSASNGVTWTNQTRFFVDLDHTSVGVPVAGVDNDLLAVVGTTNLGGTNFGSLASIVSASESGNIVTITTAKNHGFAANDTVTLSGIGTAGYNGTFTVASAPTATTFTLINNAFSNLAADASGGTAVAGASAATPGALLDGTVTANVQIGDALTILTATTSIVGNLSTISPTTGQRLPLADGDTVFINGNKFTINYQANQVVLTRQRVTGSISLSTPSSWTYGIDPGVVANVQLEAGAGIPSGLTATFSIDNVGSFVVPMNASPGNPSAATATFYPEKNVLSTTWTPGSHTVSVSYNLSNAYNITYAPALAFGSQSVAFNVVPSNVTVVGQVTATSPATIVSAKEVGTTVTVTTSAAHGFLVGQQVTIAGAGAFNGTFAVATVPSATTFTLTNPTSGLGTTSSGTVALAVPVFGQSLTLSGTVLAALTQNTPSPLLPSPTVAITIDPLSANPITIAPAPSINSSTGAYSVVLPSGLSAGSHSAAISFAGDSNYNANTTTTVSFTIGKDNSKVTIDRIVGSPALGDALQLNVHVVGATSGTFVGAVTPASVAVSSAGEVGTTVTYTTSTNHGFVVGQVVTISGFATSGFNGTYVIASVPSTTTFTVANLTTNLGVDAGGGSAVPVVEYVSIYNTAIPSLASLVATLPLDVNGDAIYAFAAAPVGSVTYSAIYSGDANYNSDVTLASDPTPPEQPLTVTVGKGLTNVNLAVPGTSTSYGQTVTLTATVTSVNANNPKPTGSVSFYDGDPTLPGSKLLGTSPLTSSTGIATFSNSLISAGNNKQFFAVYSGDNNFSTPSTGSNTFTINPAQSTIAVSASPASSMTYGNTVKFTATIGSSPNVGRPTDGQVDFVATSTIPAALVTSASESGSTVTIVTQSAHGLLAGQQVTISGVGGGYDGLFIIQSVPTTTSFTVSNGSTGLLPTSGGSAVRTPIDLGTTTTNTSGSFSVNASTLLTPGTYTITAKFSNSTNFANIVGNLGTSFTVTQPASKVTVSASPASGTAYYGQSVGLTATVVSSVGVGLPSVGTLVTFYDGATSLGSAAVDGTGTASLPSVAGLGAGPHSFTAKFAGDANLAAGTSAAVAYSINKAIVAINNTSVSGVLYYGGQIAISMKLQATSAGSPGSPAGVVTAILRSGAAFGVGTTLGTGTADVNGNVVVNTTLLPVGSNTVDLIYAGNANFQGATATLATPVVIAQATTAINPLSPSANPSGQGQTVTFSAKVLNSITNATVPAGGTVSFYRGSVAPANLLTTSVIAANGIATYSTNSLPFGPTTIYAVYNGTANLATSQAQITQTVLNASSVTITAPGTQTFGQAFNLTGTVKAVSPATGTPSGSVSVYVGSVAPGNLIAGGVALVGGAFSAPIAGAPAGTYTLYVVYTGDGAFAGSQSATSVVVRSLGTSTGLISSGSPSVFGQSVTFTATVTSTTAIPSTGQVAFYNGATLLGTQTIQNGGPGVYQFATSTLPVSTGLAIKAVFTDTAGNLGTSTGTATQVVNSVGTTASLTINPSSSLAYGNAPTFLATVAAGGSVTTGTVNFYSGATLLAANVAYNAGASGWTYTPPTATYFAASGTAYQIKAQYNGDAVLSLGTSSATQPLTVTKATTSTLLTAGSAGPNAVFQAAVTVTSGGSPGAIAGTVTFTDTTTSTVIGTATTNTNGVFVLSKAVASVNNTHNFQATFTPSAPTNWIGGFSNTINGFTVAPTGTTTALSTSPTTWAVDKPITLTATVSSGIVGVVPTGTVYFYQGSYNPAAPNTNKLGTGVVNAAGAATYTVPANTFLAGSVTILAVYNPVGVFNPNATGWQTSQDSQTQASVLKYSALTLTAALVAGSYTITATVTGANGLPAATNGTVNITVAGVPYVITLTNGKGTVNVGVLTKGATYTVPGAYLGDPAFNPANASLIFTVPAGGVRA